MGAQPSPAALHNVMSFAMQGLPNLIVYVDDLMKHNNDRMQHLHGLGELFHRLASSGLKVAPKKCKLFQSEVDFLGYHISGKGLVRKGLSWMLLEK